MPASIKVAIDDLYNSYSKKPKMFTPTKVYKAIVKDLNDKAGGAWTHAYIYNMHNGKQLDSVGAMMKWAIGELHKEITKPPKRIRSPRVEVDASPEWARECRKKLSPEKRYEVLDKAMKEMG